MAVDTDAHYVNFGGKLLYLPIDIRSLFPRRILNPVGMMDMRLTDGVAKDCWVSHFIVEL